ncbi:MAG: cytochrome C biogenesis protein, partial [Planctomycetales bacterium]|nr:cytochrome C biogenesis protein [Planctomycetales bacterium]NIM09449.1 cytochrome C biogenesis protein [Planctomycetales bacterium]NIN08931.1 cytochrome C biogenesis protein [Planctomycetales bacterium]NIN78052.1 cytochrome C biogenesis protein [Planctomycetales bacterium]NIO35230.1 cytochrome C biogenesis protein [Planctomycetales bacterium]
GMPVDFEAFFNHFSPFYNCAVLYVFVFVLTASAWLTAPLGWNRPLNWAAFGLVLLIFAVHTYAIVARIHISGRPPVTNLYGSAIFIGWGCVLLGLILEWIFRIGVGNMVAAVSGFATLLVAHFLADGDTLAVLQAVLDTQFWLATHVVTVILGYATTYVAGLLGILYILGGVFSTALQARAGNGTVGKMLTTMIYGTLCFSIFFSFVGTVLGGLWADDSWGRFWGWDPKENGALIIVLWNALVLHARWGKIVKDRGLAMLVVAGNIAVSWSWFGVNELGIGLHSYGFTEGVLKWLGIFVASQLLLIALACLPPQRWLSFRSEN